MIDLLRASKMYTTAAGPVAALAGVDLHIAPGELVALTGKSGSGKSTLLNLVAGIDHATDGDVHVDGTRLRGMRERDLARWRAATVGIVFQFFQLLPALTVLENVILPMEFLGRRVRRERRERALDLLAAVGLADHALRLPGTLSGGEQQRVAIARALANDPKVVVADEPTGNLHSESAATVIDLFRSVAKAGTTVVVATHDEGVARIATRHVRIRDGRVDGITGAFA